MASILGEKYKYADGTSAAYLEQAISQTTYDLNNATAKLNEALSMIAICGNQSTGCLDKTGRHISTWRDQRDSYQRLVNELNEKLKDLLDQQSRISANVTLTSVANTNAAQSAIASADAELKKAKSTTFKWLLYGGIFVAVIVGAIFLYKKLKKQKS